MEDRLMPAVEELRRAVRELADEVQRDPRVSSLLKLHAALNSLENQCGFDQTPLAEYFQVRAVMAVSVGRSS